MKRRKHICIIIALFAVMSIAALAAFILIRNRRVITSTRLPDLSEKKYEQFHSNVDMDNDGLDDQVDILQE